MAAITTNLSRVKFVPPRIAVVINPIVNVRATVVMHSYPNDPSCLPLVGRCIRLS